MGATLEIHKGGLKPMPNTYTIILIFVVIIIVEGIIFSLANKLKKKQNDQTETTELDKLPQTLPYEKDMLLTKTEYAFYNILKSKCDEANMLICPKVRLEDFVKVTDKENINKWRGHIRSRHVDFLICDSKLKIVAAIELMNAAQGIDFRRPLKSSPLIESVMKEYRKNVSFVEEDVVMQEYIQKTMDFLDNFDRVIEQPY